MAHTVLIGACQRMNHTITKTPLHALVATLAIVGLSSLVSAQTATSGETVKMEKFEVNSVPIEQQILPTSRPFNSVFGTDDNIIDVPRNVTIISRQQLTDISITDVLDFSKLTSSAFTTTNFGAPSNVSIRGQSADTFVNGVRARITSNGNGLPVDFNSVESVNIVKGPATAVQGTSMYVGGFIDLVTKRPYFDGTKGSVSLTMGSYDTNRWTLDVGGPLSKQLAYRFSYSGENSTGYYVDGHKKTDSFYGAITWRPNQVYELFVNSQWFSANYTENWGINRVTQDLIDNGRYVTGININNGANATPSDAQNSKYVLGGGNTIAWGPTVKINRHTRLLKPGNESQGDEYNFQAIQTAKLSSELNLKNTSYWNYTKRNTLSTYYYSEIIDHPGSRKTAPSSSSPRKITPSTPASTCVTKRPRPTTITSSNPPTSGTSPKTAPPSTSIAPTPSTTAAKASPSPAGPVATPNPVCSTATPTTVMPPPSAPSPKAPISSVTHSARSPASASTT